MTKLKRFIDGGAPALIKHIFGVLAVMGAVLIAGTLLFAEVKATEEKAEQNRQRVEAIERDINEVTTQQRLLLQSTVTEQKLNEKFRDKTSSTLERILDRLPRRERSPR